MNSKIAMVEGYEILNSFQIGKEILVLGRNKTAPEGERYIASYVENAGGVYVFSAFTPYTSESYIEAVNEYSTELRSMVVNMQIKIDDMGFTPKSIKAEDCFENDFTKNIIGKVVAIKRDRLRPECETADYQICLVTGGIGAQAFAKGGKLDCVNIYYGSVQKINREDIQGEIKPEALPFWVENYLLLLCPDRRVFAYNGKHFIPYRKLMVSELIDVPRMVISFDMSKNYDHKAFMEAAKRYDADLFLCLEDNTLYFPDRNNLLIFMGERGEQKDYLSSAVA